MQVVDHVWGADVAPLQCGGRSPDLITGADIVYEAQHFPALLCTLCQLANSHTQIYLAFRVRGASRQNYQYHTPINKDRAAGCIADSIKVQKGTTSLLVGWVTGLVRASGLPLSIACTKDVMCMHDCLQHLEAGRDVM